jgi:hypothetical protein
MGRTEKGNSERERERERERGKERKKREKKKSFAVAPQELINSEHCERIATTDFLTTVFRAIR